MWRWNCSCFMHYTQCKSLPGTGAGKKEVGDTQAPLGFFLPRYFPENLRVHSQVAVYFMIFQLRSYAGDLGKSTGVLGNIYGPVLCYGLKGQTEKKGGHLPYTLHLSLSCQLSQWVMQTLIWLDDWLHYHFSFPPGSSDFTEVAVVLCSLQVKHKGPGLLLYWTSFT